MSFASMFQRRPQGYQDLLPKDAAQRLDTFAVIDVREPSEFTGSLGHIAGAKLVPLGTIPTAAASLPRKPLLLVCRSGGRSASAAAHLAGQGFEVYNLVGGMTAWGAQGLPTTTGR